MCTTVVEVHQAGQVHQVCRSVRGQPFQRPWLSESAKSDKQQHGCLVGHHAARSVSSSLRLIRSFVCSAVLLQVASMSSDLASFLSSVDADKGVQRGKEWIEEAMRILADNGIEMPFELTDFSVDKCAEGKYDIACAFVGLGFLTRVRQGACWGWLPDPGSGQGWRQLCSRHG